MNGLRATLRNPLDRSVLTHSDNRRVSGYGTLCLRPNASAKFIPMQLFSDAMSEGTSDTRRMLCERAN